LIGVAAGLVCYWAATSLKKSLGYDDSFDVFGVHGIGGIVGALLTGIFALSADGTEMIKNQFTGQLVSVIVTVITADCSATVGLVWSSVGIEHFAHDQPPVSAKTIRIRINSDGLEKRVRIVSRGLFGRGSIKIPLTRVLQLTAEIALDLGLLRRLWVGL
jgi:hypothetical protein